MRKHGWQLPYHPLQVVAIAVFLALGFAFYVFFVPFVGKKLFQYVVMGLYTPLVACVFFLYIWCAATDPGDPGIFKSKKYLKVEDYEKQAQPKELEEGDLTNEIDTEGYTEKQLDGSIVLDHTKDKQPSGVKSENPPMPFWAVIFSLCALKFMCNWCYLKEKPAEQHMSEEGMFYCSLCEVEVLKYSKHCRVCDKCVDGFDHHCRWLNNCIGSKNYKKFFILMASALLLLILQWSVGVLVLILSFLQRKQYSAEIISKLGSSFSLIPFIVVVASCTILAMIATLPIAQLFFFHVLLIKKGISTYDYIIALREQEQEQEQVVGGQQSPQMSQVSSVTGLSSTSSFNAFHRGAWCTPPRLFLEDQFDVVPPEIGASGNNLTKKGITEDAIRKKHSGSVKINPWTLARLNAEEVSRVAAQARKKSKILQPIVRGETNHGQDTDSSMGSGSGRMAVRTDNRRRMNKRGKVPDFPLQPLTKISASATDSNGSDLAPDTSATLAPLQLEARNAFRPNMPPSYRVVASPDSSIDSPDLHPFRISSSGVEDVQGISIPSHPGSGTPKGFQLSRSTSDGYEASGGEDSDRIPSRIVHRSSNWSNVVLSSGRRDMIDVFKGSSSANVLPHSRPH